MRIFIKYKTKPKLKRRRDGTEFMSVSYRGTLMDGDFAGLDIWVYKSHLRKRDANAAGEVEIVPIPADEPVMKFKIYNLNQEGMDFVQDDGNTYYQNQIDSQTQWARTNNIELADVTRIVEKPEYFPGDGPNQQANNNSADYRSASSMNPPSAAASTPPSTYSTAAEIHRQEEVGIHKKLNRIGSMLNASNDNQKKMLELLAQIVDATRKIAIKLQRNLNEAPEVFDWG